MLIMRSDPSAADGQSAPDWAFTQLVRRIVTGEIPAGSRITEEQLASELGVSRTPLRAALARLENARIIMKQRNRALYVAPLRVEEIEELASIRERVESLVAGRAALRVKREGLSTERARTIATQFDVNGTRTAFDLFTLGEHFHLEIIRLSGLQRVSDVLSDIYLGLERYRYMLADDTQRSPRRVEEHLAILAAIERGEAEHAEALMQQHIRNGLGYFLERLAPLLPGSPR
ncbi:MAG TPA: GntR family transcriptional regulator [Microvirga sp.]|jgi:DNA-binding GntR family transcriptional regulator|nr:GntR family transcriptional regulator [Microvirga sp.]